MSISAPLFTISNALIPLHILLAPGFFITSLYLLKRTQLLGLVYFTIISVVLFIDLIKYVFDPALGTNITELFKLALFFSAMHVLRHADISQKQLEMILVSGSFSYVCVIFLQFSGFGGFFNLIATMNLDEIRAKDIFAGGRLPGWGQDVNVGTICVLSLLIPKIRLIKSNLEPSRFIKLFLFIDISCIILMQSRTGVIVLCVILMWEYRLKMLLCIPIAAALLTIQSNTSLPYLIYGYQSLINGENLSLIIRLSQWSVAWAELQANLLMGLDERTLGMRVLDSDIFKSLYLFGIIGPFIISFIPVYYLSFRYSYSFYVFIVFIVLSVVNALVLGYQTNAAAIMLFSSLLIIEKLSGAKR